MARDDASGENPSDRPRYWQSPIRSRNSPLGSTPPSRSDWERLPDDPNPAQDLGYQLEDWDAFSVDDAVGSLLFLPRDEELLRTDAFVVADASAVCLLKDHR